MAVQTPTLTNILFTKTPQTPVRQLLIDSPFYNHFQASAITI